MKCIENIVLQPEAECEWDDLEETEGFYRPLYALLYTGLPNHGRLMSLDWDDFKERAEGLYNALSHEVQRRLRKSVGTAPTDYRKNPHQKLAWMFANRFPAFGAVLKHVHLNADILLKTVALLMEEDVGAENFIRFKTKIDALNRLAWTRTQTDSESQSGVSNLGTISETLLERALADLIDGSRFFKTSNQEIQSYGDFVLMCLPNNLWLSVKSNYARERLLASGYTTDILGVGFFTDYREFTSKAKIRNFQRVGFLAMYLPDVPVSRDQQEAERSTYEEVREFYQRQNHEMPKNINGTDFLRPLSGLYNDLAALLEEENIQNRTTIKF